MDAAGIDKASVMGISEGGSLATLFAAYHPKRCENLIVYGGFASFKSWFPTEEALEELFEYVETAWGSGESVPHFVPSMAGDKKFQEWWGKYERLGASPRDVKTIMRMNSQIDITDVLPSVKVPTLILHRTDDVLIDIEGGRTLAQLIPNAKLVEFPGHDHFAFIGDDKGERVLSEIDEFLTGSKPEPAVDRVLAAVVFTDIVDSTTRAQALGDRAWHELLDAHDRTIRHELRRFRGNEIKALGDGFLATFDGPGRAIRCAKAICDAVSAIGLKVRVGVHTGEVEITENDVRGIAVHIASRIANLGKADDIMVSRTVKDLVAGSGFCFEAFGSHAFKGLADEWQVYKALKVEPA
jgi:class 3 adenylate cyclase